MRGPMNSPASTMSLYESTSVVDVCGSRVVVTPYARLMRYSHGCDRWMLNAGQMCAWMSTYPGMIVLPVTSISFVPDGICTFPCGPTATMRLSFTRTSPFGMTSFPFIVRMRAPRSTTVPDGRSFRTRDGDVEPRRFVDRLSRRSAATAAAATATSRATARAVRLREPSRRLRRRIPHRRVGRVRGHR